jgi:histidinol phosphatase-like enzyme
MVTEVLKVGGHITQVFSATELKNSNSLHRKPNPKMALMAKEIYPNVIFEKSIMVGDTDSDIQFGKNLGMRTVLVLTEEITTEIADLEVESIAELNKLIGTEI